MADILLSISLEKQAADTDNAELVSVQTELGKSQYYLKGLYESLVNGDITDSEYKEMKVAYEAKITSLTERERYLCEADKQRLRQESAFSGAHKSVQTIKQISDLTTEVIDRLVERINVYEDKRITVKFTFLDEVLSSDGRCGE